MILKKLFGTPDEADSMPSNNQEERSARLMHEILGPPQHSGKLYARYTAPIGDFLVCS